MRLPRAEAIGLTNAVGQTMMRLWEDVEAVCGPFTQEPGINPPRFLPPAWPDVAAWKRLRTEFEAPEWAPEDDDESRI